MTDDAPTFDEALADWTLGIRRIVDDVWPALVERIAELWDWLTETGLLSMAQEWARAHERHEALQRRLARRRGLAVTRYRTARHLTEAAWEASIPRLLAHSCPYWLGIPPYICQAGCHEYPVCTEYGEMQGHRP